MTELNPRKIGLRAIPLADDLLKVVTAQEAILLAHLIDLIITNAEVWVPFNTIKIKAHLNLSKRQQDWLLHKLKRRGFVLTRVEGFKKRRFAAVNFSNLECEIGIKKQERSAVQKYPQSTELQCTKVPAKHRRCAMIPYNAFSYQKKGVPQYRKASTAGLPDNPTNKADKHTAQTISHELRSKEDVMAFKMEVESTADDNPLDKARIRKLLDHVIKIGYYPIARSRDKWKVPFAQLRRHLAGRDELIDAVLDWFCSFPTKQALKDTKLPTGVCNALYFRKNWEWIHDRYEKHRSGIPAKVEVGADALAIVKRLKMNRWPKGSAEQLPAAVQVSINALAAFHRKVAEVRKESFELDRITSDYFTYTKINSFIEKWFNNVHKRIANWDAWSGNLDAYIFKHSSEQFQNHGKAISVNLCGKPYLWERLYERVNNDD